MSPQELRAFRESLGLSRREFAPKLFISEPTLERWERGQGGPREVHLHILGRMREHLTAGNAIAYFRYDASELAHEPEREEKQVVVEALKAAGALLCEEKDSKDRSAWTLRFGLPWASGKRPGPSLLCEGSYRLERPFIDFTLKVACDSADMDDVAGIEDICFAHAAGWKRLGGDGRRCELVLRLRLFNTACNAETIQHILGDLRSCWERVRECLRVGTPAQLSSRRRRTKRAGVPVP
jgi:transcriptional regulator with XRE-family HTH domain